MFELAITHAPFETPIVLNSVFVPQPEHRYCPVLITRGLPEQYLEHHETPSALVAKKPLYNLYTDQLSVTFDWSELLRNYDSDVEEVVAPQDVEEDEDFKSLLAYITDVIPEFKPEYISDTVAFHDVTEKKLTSCMHEKGMTLVWNDEFVPIDHPARKHCGEGPFKVVRNDSCLMSFTVKARDPSSRNTLGLLSSGIGKFKNGNNRLILESVNDGNTVIAHGGFFVELDSNLHQDQHSEPENYWPLLEKPC